MRQLIAILCGVFFCFAVFVVVAHYHDGTDFSSSCAICIASKISFSATNSSPYVFLLWSTHVSTPEATLIPPPASAAPSASRAPPA
jgi:hypothetical protein